MLRDLRFQLLAVISLGAIGGYLAATSGATPALRDSAPSSIAPRNSSASVSPASEPEETPECCRLEDKLGLGARVKETAKAPAADERER